MTDDLVVKAVNFAVSGKQTFCKFLSANDSGETGGHQSGILISKTAKSMLFTDQEMNENHILKKYGRIKWQDDFETKCTFTWYESKNELRITGFGRGFDLLRPEYTGALFILIKQNEEEYLGFILNTDDGIQDFLDAFGLTPAETNRLIEVDEAGVLLGEVKEKEEIARIISGLQEDFPTTSEMAGFARMIQYQVSAKKDLAIRDPDSLLLIWTEQEYRLFRAIEHNKYGATVKNGFESVDDFVILANQVLNRRKSRAGKSLEHHLAALFDENKLQYEEQVVTEGNKKPDFIFPSKEAYHDKTFPAEKLCVLAAKTTCKDRWRQVLNEANRLRDDYKYLCTMQQGISLAQMDEMHEEKVVLVVPKAYITAYPKERRDRIWTIARFIDHIKRLEGLV